MNVSYLLTATLRWEKVGGSSRVHVSPELVDVTHPDAPISKWQQPFDAALIDACLWQAADRKNTSAARAAEAGDAHLKALAMENVGSAVAELLSEVMPIPLRRVAVTTFAFLGVNMFLSGLHSYGTL